MLVDIKYSSIIKESLYTQIHSDKFRFKQFIMHNSFFNDKNKGIKLLGTRKVESCKT